MKSEKRGNVKRKVSAPRGGSHPPPPRPRPRPPRRPAPPPHLHSEAQDRPTPSTVQPTEREAVVDVMDEKVSTCVMSLEDIEGDGRKKISPEFLRRLRNSPFVKSAEYNFTEFPEMVQLSYVAKDPPPSVRAKGGSIPHHVDRKGAPSWTQEKLDKEPVRDLMLEKWRRPAGEKVDVHEKRHEKRHEAWDDDDLLEDGSFGVLTLNDLSKQSKDV
jgi:hypothetical protein